MCLLWVGSSSSQIPASLGSSSERCALQAQCFKWNVDASVSLATSSSAIGGVLRIRNDIFKCVFLSPIRFMEINCAEVLPIQRAIKITLSSLQQLLDKSLKIEFDSANAVRWSNSYSNGPWNMKFQLNFIRSSCASWNGLSITHKGRSKLQFRCRRFSKTGLN